MAELRWTEEAERSLRDIYEHIAHDRPATARRTVDSLIHRTESLTDYPNLGQPYAYHPQLSVRVLTYGQFQIVYQRESESSLVVLGVFHGLIFLPLK